MEIENMNYNKNDAIEANSIEGAINALSSLVGEPQTNLSAQSKSNNGKINSTAIFNSFKERELPKLRKEYPTFKFSQINQMIVKLWLKSPENPANYIE